MESQVEILMIVADDPGIVVDKLLEIPAKMRRRFPMPVVWIAGDGEPVRFDSENEAISKLM
ncbi:MAG: hypothetical protein JW850_04545 [Thermoflexales bacterium]|nr:hypothetical protein [Thermoflexales bacterium]